MIPKNECPECKDLPEGQVVEGHDHRVKRFPTWNEGISVISMLLVDLKKDFPERWMATKIFLERDLKDDLAAMENLLLDVSLDDLLKATEKAQQEAKQEKTEVGNSGPVQENLSGDLGGETGEVSEVPKTTD